MFGRAARVARGRSGSIPGLAPVRSRTFPASRARLDRTRRRAHIRRLEALKEADMAKDKSKPKREPKKPKKADVKKKK